MKNLPSTKGQKLIGKVTLRGSKESIAHLKINKNVVILYEI